MRKFVTLLATLTLVVAVGCGGGKEVPDYGDGEDDIIEAPTTGDTAGTAAPAAATPAAVAGAATVSGLVKFEGAAPAMGNLQMGADAFCASHHTSGPVKDEDVVVGPGGELANV